MALNGPYKTYIRCGMVLIYRELSGGKFGSWCCSDLWLIFKKFNLWPEILWERHGFIEE